MLGLRLQPKMGGGRCLSPLCRASASTSRTLQSIRHVQELEGRERQRERGVKRKSRRTSKTKRRTDSTFVQETLPSRTTTDDKHPLQRRRRRRHDSNFVRLNEPASISTADIPRKKPLMPRLFRMILVDSLILRYWPHGCAA